MGRVVGPISSVDWRTLIMLRSSISYLQERVGGNPLHAPAIETENRIYRSILDPYLRGDDDKVDSATIALAG